MGTTRGTNVLVVALRTLGNRDPALHQFWFMSREAHGLDLRECFPASGGLEVRKLPGPSPRARWQAPRSTSPSLPVSNPVRIGPCLRVNYVNRVGHVFVFTRPSLDTLG